MRYSFADLKLFIGSLRQTSFKGDVAILISGVSPSNQYQLRQYGVNAVPYNSRYPYIHTIKLRDKPYADIKCETERIPMFRFLLYYFYLTACKGKYSKVLLTDTRDVIFQKNPFEYNIDENLVYSFSEKKNIGACSINSEWIRKSFGQKALDEIQHNKIICSGVVLGGTGAIEHYLKILLNAMTQGTNSIVAANDQPCHNYIIYKKHLSSVIVPIEESPVLTLHYMPKSGIHINNDGFLLNNKQEIAYIVHQYDRHAFLVDLFKKKYDLPRQKIRAYIKIYDFLWRIYYGVNNNVRLLSRKALRIAAIVRKYFLKIFRMKQNVSEAKESKRLK